jgi:taurine dioxygenase
MTSISMLPLEQGLPFGASVQGVTLKGLADETVRAQLNAWFVQRGLLVFESIEQSSEMQVALSLVFGPLKEHPVKTQVRVDENRLPGVIVLAAGGPDMAVVEIDGKPLTSWQPWHFDHCYTRELNLAGVLRALQIAPQGGLTAFADGIQMYDALPPALRRRIEGRNIIYTLDPLFSHMRFGKPKNFREIKEQRRDVLEIAKTMPRALHPAVWTRPSGERVLHLAPWMAVGIEDGEDPEGEALLHEVWETMQRVMRPYIHRWSEGDMLIWDNSRMIHEACGCDPKYPRVMHRTTIAGDYGFGRFEELQ